MGVVSVYSVTFPDNEDGGPITVSGTQVGDVILKVIGTGALAEVSPASYCFESAISVAGQVQQAAGTGYSSATWKAIVARG